MGKYVIPISLVVIVILLGAWYVVGQKTTASPASISTNVYSTNSPQSTKEVQVMNTPTQAASQIDKTKQYEATLTTNLGEITIALNAAATPITVNNFVSLARKGFYDKTTFHRVIKGFMIQGGDPKGDGTGGPGYRFDDESFSGEYTRGTIAMANAGPNTNGSQFFIMHADYPLPKNYVIFGSVIRGMEVVDSIATAPTKTGLSGENSTPVTPVVVSKVVITEK